MSAVPSRLFLFVALFWTSLCFAVQPYVAGDKLPAGELKGVMAQAEQKLVAVGFQVVGRHQPAGLPKHGAIVVTDKAMLDAVLAAGGPAIVAAGIRIGVQADGRVSYMNPEYWYRAFLRKQFGAAESAVRGVQERLGKALGSGEAFGGEVAADALPAYRYMWGMERFDDAGNALESYASFDEAVKTIRDNLGRKVGQTEKVYELVFPERKLAVFGVAMNDPATGEGWWVNKVGPDHIAALPWEIYVVDGKAGALQGRYRTALAWPGLSMGTFMGISNHPGATHDTLKAVAARGGN
jgi:hypothetical protein